MLTSGNRLSCPTPCHADQRRQKSVSSKKCEGDTSGRPKPQFSVAAIRCGLTRSTEAYVVEGAMQGNDEVISCLAVIGNNVALTRLLKGSHGARARPTLSGETAMTWENSAMAGHVGPIRDDRPLRLIEAWRVA